MSKRYPPGKGGILSVEVEGVLARLTRKESASAELRKRLPAMVSVGAVVGSVIRDRVRGDQKPASAWKGYSRRGSRHVPRRIRQKARQVSRPRYASSHAIPRQGLASVTGAMWQNVESVSAGADSARIQFRGTSDGFRWLNLGMLGGLRFPVRSAIDVRIRNQSKANAIHRHTGLHVLDTTNGEILAVAELFVRATTGALVAFFAGEGVPAAKVRFPGADRRMARRLRRLHRG